MTIIVNMVFSIVLVGFIIVGVYYIYQYEEKIKWRGFKRDKFVISEIKKNNKKIFECESNYNRYEKKYKNQFDLAYGENDEFIRPFMEQRKLYQKDVELRESIVSDEEGEQVIKSTKEIINNFDAFINNVLNTPNSIGCEIFLDKEMIICLK